MKRPQHISLVVTSHTATLAQLAPALGDSALKHHELGSHRANGLIRPQSVWFGHWSADAGEIEDLLEEVLEWLSERKSAVITADPSAYLKIVYTPGWWLGSCSLYGGQTGGLGRTVGRKGRGASRRRPAVRSPQFGYTAYQFIQAEAASWLGLIPVLGIMKKIFAILLVISTFGAAAGTSEQNATCIANPPIEALSATEREAVTEALKLHSKHMCASDACEFRVRKLADGRTLVSLRAARYAKELEQCVTVYMGRAGVVFDSAGEIHDRWQYCHVVVEELKNDPTLEKELGYHRCEKPA